MQSPLIFEQSIIVYDQNLKNTKYSIFLSATLPHVNTYNSEVNK
jgi:hypothetical protein